MWGITSLYNIYIFITINAKQTGFKAFAKQSLQMFISVCWKHIWGHSAHINICIVYLCAWTSRSPSLSAWLHLSAALKVDELMWWVITEACPGSTCWFGIPRTDNVFRLSSTLLQAGLGLHPVLTKMTKHDGSPHCIFVLGDHACSHFQAGQTLTTSHLLALFSVSLHY